MIHINYSPQRSDNPVSYSWAAEVLTATIGSASDTFDFSALKLGDKMTATETNLPYNPVISAARAQDGSLDVVLLYTYGKDEKNAKNPEVING